jgi:hypothetical protein
MVDLLADAPPIIPESRLVPKEDEREKKTGERSSLSLFENLGAASREAAAAV